MGRHVWSEEKKSEALVLLADPELSYYDVHKATGVPASTLHDWAAAAGLVGHSDRVADTEKARRARMERVASKRAVIAERFLDSVETFLEQSELVAEGMIEVKEGVFVSGGRDAEALVRAASTALGAFRLEMGEHTQATRSEAGSPRDRVKDRVDELEAKRQQRSA